MTHDIKRVVTASNEDVRNTREFFKHFKIPVTERLEKAIEIFEKNPTVETQDEFASAVTDAVLRSGHHVFEDELFDEARRKSEEITYRNNFDKSLEEHLNPKEKEEP